ncbi:Uncharacterised protein [Chlamydia abortus]|uniref:DUF2508 family protein n=1 Tax=Paenibacillus residui TaxID=629724 RepID=A0ABW3D408_9BACL|nr:DUF2508 family protein [Paenibacillus sp. 32O-W]SHE14903.1 Uncharacterised protein [Chlamydia abortus]
MKWFLNWRRNKETAASIKDKLALLEEIRQSQLEWRNAQHRLEWVVGQDEVDCAIYDLVAAEKKYEMLLRLAKQQQWNQGFVNYEREVI